MSHPYAPVPHGGAQNSSHPQPGQPQGWAPSTQPPTAMPPNYPGQAMNVHVHQGPMPFAFDGGAGSYLLVGIGAFLITLFTFGLAAPWAACMFYRWQSHHTLIGGRRIKFTGTGAGLFGHYIIWWLLTLVTFGIYSFWLVPQMTKWAVEHQRLD